MSHPRASVAGARLVEPAAVVPAVPLVAFGDSDVGQVRESNEDSFGVLPSLGLFMVADGMGGAAAGEVASRVLIREVRKAVEDSETTWPNDGSINGPDSAPRRLLAGVHRASRRIHGMAVKDVRKKGMGTTFAGLLLRNRCAMIAYVGDSRVYRFRAGKLEQLTHDHTFVNELVARGWLTPEAALTSRRRHILTRAVGVHEAVDVDTKIVDLRSDDVLLVSSDGLHGEVHSDEIAEILGAGQSPEATVAQLIRRANDKGGPDNITAIVVRVEEA